jgi:hypothetical protein
MACVNFFSFIKFNCFSFLHFCFLNYYFPLVLSYVLQICVIEFMWALEWNMPYKFIFQYMNFKWVTFSNAYNNHILGMENFSHEKIIDNICNLMMWRFKLELFYLKELPFFTWIFKFIELLAKVHCSIISAFFQPRFSSTK